MNGRSSQSTYTAWGFWALILLAPLPGLSVYLAWISELEQYGYLLPLFLALIALILFRWDHVIRMPGDASSLALVGLSTTVTVVGAYRNSPWFSAIGFALAAAAWLRVHRSADDGGHRLTYLALLLVMLIRLPLNLDLQLSSALQTFTSKVSSHLLDAAAVTHYLRGNVLELPGGTLFVEEACSGVQSLFTILFLVCLWMVLVRRPLIATPAYLLAGVIWAMVMNVVRITSIALAQEWYGYNWSTGTAHEILGWVCLLVAALMMLSTDRLLRVAFYPVPPDESGNLGNPVARIWNAALLLGMPEPTDDEFRSSRPAPQPSRPIPWMTRSLLVASVLFFLTSIAFGARMMESRIAQVVRPDQRPLLWDPDAALLNTTSYASLITDHQSLREADSKQLGNHADVWTVMMDGLPVRIAISQPYPEWHDMRRCYTGNGWQINDWNAVLPPPETNSKDPSAIAETPTDGWPVSHAELVRESGDYGTLMFCGLTYDRELLSPPMAGLLSMFGNRVKDRSSLRPNVIMLQLWTETQTPIVPEQMTRLRQLFEAFRLTVHDRLPVNAGPNTSPSDLDTHLTAVSAHDGARRSTP
ncbi:exosortase U [Roseiconus nitratireducens]|uniref:Exosortase U n=1 Tax=Roseiconus nitratireducens TaxID=2605748 RepID=A0A5M6DCM4_9BACT|nr:exosortase U [Roseiconus nitratireducens]KAA5543829.1 exosortase U [Roseiconus nitratireducens]